MGKRKFSWCVLCFFIPPCNEELCQFEHKEVIEELQTPEDAYDKCLTYSGSSAGTGKKMKGV